METLMQPTKCEACGGELEFRREGSTQGFFCKTCDWAVVTTYIPRIDLDQTKYGLHAIGGDFHDENQVRAVAQVSGLNFIGARKLLQQGDPLVLEARAPEILAAKIRLNEAGLRAEISPPFPIDYENADRSAR
jgi:hypothetical protein